MIQEESQQQTIDTQDPNESQEIQHFCSEFPMNDSAAKLADEDKCVQLAYEKYALSQFLFKDQQEIQKCRQNAIESLTPGTLHHYHLFFLDLLKTKKNFSEFSQSEKDLYVDFKENFDKTVQFNEVKIKLNLLNQFENLPQIDENSSLIEINQFLKVTSYLEKKLEKHPIDLEQAEKFLNEQSENENQNEDQNDADILNEIFGEKCFNYEEYFDRSKYLQKAQEYINNFINYHKNKAVHLDNISGFENEIDWSKIAPEYAFKLVQEMMAQKHPQSYKIFEMTNYSFLEKICEFIKQKHDAQQNQLEKFEFPQNFYEYFTIDQLDIIRNTLRKKEIEIKDKEFFKQYFLKVFSEELSQENQDQLTNQEKLKNLHAQYIYAKDNKFSKGLCAILLHELLALSIKCNDFKEDLFILYLENPIEKNESYIKKTAIEFNQKAEQKRKNWNACLQDHSNDIKRNWKRINNQNNIILKYLNFIFSKDGKLDKYSSFFKNSYLKEIEKKNKVYQSDHGLIGLQNEIDQDEFKKIEDEVILRFQDTNKESFKVDEKVVLYLELKNIPELTIKIFEFNTETYYKQNMKAFDSSIDLQGLQPSFKRVEKDKFKNIKKNKILKEIFEFDELNGKVGLFIIEFEGNGIISRAIVKKGSLSLIHRSTASGHMAFIIDSNREICKSKDSGIWINKKFYQCDLDQNGAIFIPYLQDGPKLTTLIMIHEGFAQLGELEINTEKYDLDFIYHIVSESILFGQEAKILIKPCLSVNGKKTYIKQLKNTKIDISLIDLDDIQQKFTFNDVKFNDNEETVLSFSVPINLNEIQIDMQAQVLNATQKVLQDFKIPTKSIMIQGNTDVYEVVSERYLRKIGENYFIYKLGRNGEVPKNKSISFKLKHKYFGESDTQEVQVDNKGRICLGKLKDIEKIQMDYHVNSYEKGQESWYINQVDGDIWSLPDQFNIIEGESIQIPVNLDKEQKLQRYQVSFEMQREGKLIKNMFDRIKLIQSEKGGQYKLLLLESLENGEYTLSLKISANQFKTVKITVHKGNYWQGNFIIKKNCLIENISQKYALRLENIEMKNISENDIQISIQCSNFSEKTRIHLFSTQFVPNDSVQLAKDLQKFTKEKFNLVKFPFASWKNIFDQEKLLSDEIRYAIKRKQYENQIGNLLDRPTLFVKKQFNQFTETENEVLQEGTSFEKKEEINDYDKKAEIKVAITEEVNENLTIPQNGKRAKKAKKGKKKKKAKKQRQKRFDRNEHPQIYSNIIKDYQNFLSSPPQQIFNLKPNQNGEAQSILYGIKDFSQIFIIACDEDSVCQRELSINSQEKEFEIPKKDLRQNQIIDETDLIEQKQALTLIKDSQHYLEDISCIKYQIIDNLIHLTRAVEAIWFVDCKTQYGPQYQSFVHDHLLKWHLFNFQQKVLSYNKYFSHDLNFFIFKKDKEFFQKVVLENILSKMEKTFVDWYLLSQFQEKSFHQFYLDKVINIILENKQMENLNDFEICLLIECCFKFGSQKHKNTAKILSKNILQANQNKMNSDEGRIYKYVSKFEAVLNLTDQGSSVIDTKDIDFTNKIELNHKFYAEYYHQNGKFNPEYYGVGGGGGGYGEDDESEGYAHGGAEPMSISQSKVKQDEKNIFDCEDDFLENKKQEIVQQIDFKELDKTAEYIETHYFLTPKLNNYSERHQMNQFFAAYIQYLIDSFEKNDNNLQFLTSNIFDLDLKDLPLILSLLDLPQQKLFQHEQKSDGNRGIIITLKSNAIILKKEIIKCECKLQNDMILRQRYEQLEDDCRNEEAKDFIINKPYECQVIISNLSSEFKKVNLLMKIPNGSVPILDSKHTTCKSIIIPQFETIRESIQFYFPEQGEYQQYPSNVSQNGVVIAKSEIQKFQVLKKKAVVDNMEKDDFRKLMKKLPNDYERKNKILDLLENQLDKCMDQKFSFSFKDDIVQYLAIQDKDFGLQLIEAAERLNIINDENYDFIFTHFKDYLLDEKNKNKRELIIKIYKKNLTYNDILKNQPLSTYMLKSFSNQILDIPMTFIYDQKFQHLEYHPIVNSRIFPVGGQDSQDDIKNKQILNNEFKRQYYQLIHLLVHQDKIKDKQDLNLNTKLKLQLVYYLQLQDRIEEAIYVLDSIEIQSIQQGGEHDYSCQVMYDYMKAYFDFFNAEFGEDQANKFLVARQIVKKYENCQIQTFQIAFGKIREQLQDLDKTFSIYEGLNDKSDEPEQFFSKEPKIQRMKIDQNTGEIEIESQNIEIFTAKYYLIDSEILFSKSPFVQNHVERFGYVKPFLEIKKQAAAGSNTKIDLPNELHGKNLIIEVNSQEIQKFFTFFSSMLVIQCNQDFGEIRVCHKQTKQPLPKVYVKVFGKLNSGQDQFFKDGFTDIKGKFQYATTSGKSLEDIKKFSIFLDHQIHGSLIKEFEKPQNC